MPPGLSTSDFFYILPEIVLTAGSLLLLIADVLLPRRSNGPLTWVTLGVLGATFISLFWPFPFFTYQVEVAHGLIAVDRFAFFFKLLFLIAAAVTVLMSTHYLDVEGVSPGAAPRGRPGRSRPVLWRHSQERSPASRSPSRNRRHRRSR